MGLPLSDSESKVLEGREFWNQRCGSINFFLCSESAFRWHELLLLKY